MTVRQLLDTHSANRTAVEIYDIDDSEVMKTDVYSILVNETNEDIANATVQDWDIYVDINGEPEICIRTDYEE